MSSAMCVCVCVCVWGGGGGGGGGGGVFWSDLEVLKHFCYIYLILKSLFS